MSANPHANGGLLLRDLRMPDFAGYAVPVTHPGTGAVESTRLGAVFDATDRAWNARTVPEDDHLARDGRVMEILSEHTCQGWLEGYLLSGRHGFFPATRRSSTSSTQCSTSTPSG